MSYCRRPVEVEAVQFLKAGDHPAVASRWMRAAGEPYPTREGMAQIWDLYEGEPFESPLCSASTPGAEERHTLSERLIDVAVGDWIVTEHGATRVVPDAEFQRDYQDARAATPEVREALQALYDACTEANAAAIEKLNGTVIDLGVLSAADSALCGERVVYFCGGWPNVLTGPSAEFHYPTPLEWGDDA
jgi:hypothetical protein